MTLEAFAPIPRMVEIDGRGIAILPMKVRQLPAFSKAIGGLMPMVMAGRYQEVAFSHADAMADAVAAATDLDRDWIGGLYPDAFLRLVGAVLEANLDFFARRVLPETRAVTRALASVMERAGGNSSHGSPDADTGQTTP